MTSVYLAGPDVFYIDAIERGERLKDICREHGLKGVFPLDNNIPQDVMRLGKHGIAQWIRFTNEQLMQNCDALIANMTPFRGVSMDVGTAYEMGFASALGKPIFGYSEDIRTYKQKMIDSLLVSGEKNGVLIAQDGMTVEDFDHRDNLMMVAGHPEISNSFHEALLKFCDFIQYG